MKFLRRVFFWGVLLTILGSVFLHYHYQIPWISSWFGSLPGDVVVMKGTVAISLPVVSAFVLSFFFVLLLFLF